MINFQSTLSQKRQKSLNRAIQKKLNSATKRQEGLNSSGKTEKWHESAVIEWSYSFNNK